MEWECLSPEFCLACRFVLHETLRYRIITDYICGTNNIVVIYLSIFFYDGDVNW